jgi:hypothetical protein
VDPVSGRVLSRLAGLEESADAVVGRTYRALLEYSPVIEEGAAVGNELVRLSPPEGAAAPAVFIERSALELLEPGTGVMTHFNGLPSVVELAGHVTVAGSAEPSRATVSLVATDILELEPGVLGSYQRTVEVSEDGRFRVEVLPGTYRVIAVPPVETGLAAAEAVWEVGVQPEVQEGRAIELAGGASIEGIVLGPGANPATGASVHAVPSPSAARKNVLSQALGDKPFLPRATTAVAGDRGQFQIVADPGTFDVSIRPPEGAGFAWMVRPNVLVPATGQDLGSITLPLPLSYRGRITSPDTGSVSGALVRAYLFMDASGSYTTDAEQAAAVVQLAETRADEAGDFHLLIPARLN